MKFNHIFLSYLFLHLILHTSNALANKSSLIQVTANVIKFCNIRSTPFEFGEYNSSGDIIAKANVTVTCTGDTIYYISVSQNTRAMINSKNDMLLYSVYSDQEMSKALGDQIKKNSISGIGTGRPENIILYAVIKGGQNVSNGEYSDMLNITLSF